MIWFKPISATSKGELICDYMTEDESPNDQPRNLSGRALTAYYTGRDTRASWRPDMSPAVARALGIDASKPPADEALARLFEARRADTGDAWSSHKRDISAYDFVFSPAKSVSLAIEFESNPALKAAMIHAVWKANDDAMRHIGREMGWARRGDGGQDGADPGEVAWASFMHTNARPTIAVQDGPNGRTYLRDVPVPGDPLIHIHNSLFNLVVTADGHIGSLDTQQLRERVEEFGAYAEGRLATFLSELGVEIEYSTKEQAVEIAAIAPPIREAYSKGNKTVGIKAKQYAERQGLDWDAMSAEGKFSILRETARATRLDKFDGKPDSQIWREQAAALGWNHTGLTLGEPAAPLSRAERIERGATWTAERIAREFETEAVIDVATLRTWSARALIGTGSEDAGDIDAIAARVEEIGITLHGQHADLIVAWQDGHLRMTNSVQVALEQEVAALAAAAAADRSRALSPEAIERAIAASGIDYTSNPEAGASQLAAIRAMGTGGALSFVEGVAGVGKTRKVLPPLVAAYLADGRDVIGISPAWRQADELQEAGIRQTYAVEPFLRGVASGEIRITGNTVIALDEAAQVNVQQLRDILRLWRDHGAVVHSMGDRRQCKPIGAGSGAELMARNLPEEARPELLITVRQIGRTKEETRRLRKIAGLFRDGKAAEALAMKRQDGSAWLVGGDHEQVVGRMAEFYLQRRDALRAAGAENGVLGVTYTNNDAMELGQEVRARLRERGEIRGAETVYQATNGQRGHRRRDYDLALALGDRFRLYRKTFGTFTDGTRGFIGSNGHMVEVADQWAGGLVLRNDKGQVARVEWRRLRDGASGRLRLGPGFVATIDAAQGATVGEVVHVLPRGAAGSGAGKAYTAESRHISRAWTLVAEAPVIEAERLSRPLGDGRAITHEDLWTRIARNMSADDPKALGSDLAAAAARGHRASVDSFIRADLRLRQIRAEGRDFAGEVAERLRDNEMARGLGMGMEALATTVARTGEAIEGLRQSVTDGLRDLRGKVVEAVEQARQSRPEPDDVRPAPVSFRP